MSIIMLVLAAGFWVTAGIMQWPWLALVGLGLSICALAIGGSQSRPAAAVTWIRKTDDTMPPAHDDLPTPLLVADWITLNDKTSEPPRTRANVLPAILADMEMMNLAHDHDYAG